MNNYIIYTSNGFLADWSHAVGKPTYTNNPDDAALFNAHHARIVRRLANGCVLEIGEHTTLLTLTELNTR